MPYCSWAQAGAETAGHPGQVQECELQKEHNQRVPAGIQGGIQQGSVSHPGHYSEDLQKNRDS